jgi:hypothetical protein
MVRMKGSLWAAKKIQLSTKVEDRIWLLIGSHVADLATGTKVTLHVSCALDRTTATAKVQDNRFKRCCAFEWQL